ncbi:MAG TPA: alpha/beta hydrolase [Thermoanaerobaculia bacterium]|nr:alpha/beta hydrolase [Thermoanaerobaculia bacterium]
MIRRALLALVLLSGCAHNLPVVFVHGNGANANQWRAQAAHLQATRQAIAFDLPGMGSAPPASDYSVASNAEAIGRVADAHQLKRFVLVAHSYGGAPAAYYASKHPERVAGLILVDSAWNVKIDDAVAKRFADALRKDEDKVLHAWFGPILEHSSPEVRKEVLDDAKATNVEVFITTLDGLRFIDMKALLDAYPGPKFAIAAADIEKPSSLHNQYPSIPVKKIPGAGHWLMLDKPHDVNRALDEFLTAIP